MPIYEYRCKDCQEVTEVLQKFSDAPLTTCKSCGGTLERLISPPGLQFKGTGWYVTDYARAGQKPAEAKSPKDDKPAKKTETKPAERSTTESKSKSD
jgi:putative FmdB family regulatory protein